VTLGALLARAALRRPEAETPKTASGKILRRLLRGGQFTEVRP